MVKNFFKHTAFKSCPFTVTARKQAAIAKTYSFLIFVAILEKRKLKWIENLFEGKIKQIYQYVLRGPSEDMISSISLF